MMLNTENEGMENNLASLDLQQLQFALHAAGIGTWSLDPINQLVHWDARCRALYGFSEEDEVPYEEVLKHIHPEDIESVKVAVGLSLNSQIRASYDIRFRTLDKENGLQRWVHCKGQAYFNAEGNAVQFAGIAQDITEALNAAARQRDAEQLSQLSLEGTNAGFFRTNLLTDELQHSPIVAKLVTGVMQDNMSRMAMTNHIHPEDTIIRQMAYREMLRTGKFQYVARFVWLDGSIHKVRFIGSCQFDPTGKPMLLSGIGQEVGTEAETAAVKTEIDSYLSSIIGQAPVAMCLLRGEELVIEVANEDILEYWGKGQEVVGKPLLQAIPELAGQVFVKLLHQVRTSGMPYYGNGMKADFQRQGKLVESYFNFVYAPFKAGKDDTDAVIITATDVTELIKAKKEVEQSEQRFRSLIQEAPIATCLFVGNEMVVEVANDIMLDYWGQAPAIVGLPLIDAVPELKGQPFLQILENVFTTGETFVAEAAPAQLKRNGKIDTYYFDYTYKPLRNAQGEIYAIMNMAIDVTEKVLSRKRLEESEISFRLLADSMPQFIWTGDPEGNLNYFNQAVFEYTGLEYDQLVNGKWLRILHPEEARDTWGLWQQAIDTGDDFIFRHRFKNKDGEYRWQLSRATPQKDAAGQIQRWIGTSTDIHEQKLYEEDLQGMVQEKTEELQAVNEELTATNEELVDLNNDLIRSNEQLSQYAYVASHDLQEPLRKIMFFTNYLTENEQFSERGMQYAGKIEKSAERMSILIRDLLKFSGLLSIDQELTTVDLHATVQSIVTDFELKIGEKDALIEIGLLPAVEAVSLQMNQLFYNLISNALKFSSPNRRPTITVQSTALSCEQAAAYMDKPKRCPYYLITVSDNGIGFESRYADQIFDVFKRLHPKDSYGGSGVGLAICKRVVDNHHGQLWVDSEPGKGTTFSMLLPSWQRGRE